MKEYLEDELIDTALTKERFRKFVEYAKYGNEENRQKGRLGACEELDGYIGYIIKKKFDAYVRNDPDFRQDLMQSGRMSVIQALDGYDVDKTRPATYFYIFIFHELLEQVIVMKHGITSYMATVINKINRVNRDFDLKGKVPALEDYKRETNLTENQIKSALDIITSTTVNLDDPEVLQKEDEQYRRLSTEIEACSRMNAEKIIKAIYRTAEDPIIALCLYEKIIEGYRLCELALKYQRAERELRLSMSSVLRKLRKSRELRGMYSKKTHRS